MIILSHAGQLIDMRLNDIKTERLNIIPMQIEELQGLVKKYKTDALELSQAYGEMLRNCTKFSDEYLWYTSWKILLDKTDETVGYACFKGIMPDGSSELGYGIDEEYQNKGYATEAVVGLCQWAFSTSKVISITAEIAADNISSEKVLRKAGFVPTGKMGEEGPLFVVGWEKLKET